MCQTDQNFDFFRVSFSHDTLTQAFMVDIKDKAAKTALLKAMHFSCF